MKNKNLGIALVVILVIIAIGGYYFPQGNTLVERIVGVTPGTDFIQPDISVGGVSQRFVRQRLYTATTTPCSIRSPAASSTLIFSSVTLRTATSTATVWTLATSTTAFATTSTLQTQTVASGQTPTLQYFISSSTQPYAGVMAPNTWVVWSHSGIDVSMDSTLLNGNCQAEFRVH